MEKEIKFKKFDAQKSDFDCAQGEVYMPYNGRVNADGTYGVNGYETQDDGVKGDEMNYAIWDGEEYQLHGSTDARPIVEFALHKEGILTSGTTITTTADTGTDTSAEIFKGVARQFKEAIDLQITGKGYFWQPFMVRYGVRLTDGTYLMLSGPVLMLPTVLPPCIGLRVTTETIASETKTHVTPDFSRIGRYTLQYRISETAQNADTQQIAAIDIFVTEPVSTYVADSIEGSYATTYAEVVQAGPSYPIRGRNLGQNVSTETIFEGHYSDGNGAYADHNLDVAALNLTVAMVRPNVNLIEDITSCSRFYRIASIPWRDIASAGASEGFALVPIHGDSLYELATRPQMPTDGIRLSDVKAGAVAAINGRLIIGTTGIRVPHPIPLAAMASYSGTPTAETLTHTIIRVYTSAGGRIYMTTLEEESAIQLSAGLPRYLYQPDSRTVCVTVSQNGTTYYFPFTPHPSGYGAQWWGGIEESVEVETLDIDPYPDAETSNTYECAKILTTRPRSGGLIADENIIDLGEGKVASIIEATKAPTRGTFGKYTAYALTTHGVWMLEYDSAKSRITSAQRINADSVPGRQGAVTDGENAYYISGDCIKRLSGSETEVISGALTSQGTGIGDLPHIAEILRQCGLPEHIPENVAVEDGTLTYDDATSTLRLTASDGQTYAYGIETGTWTIVDIIDNEELPTLLLATRPVRLGEQIRSVEVLGRFTPSHVGIAVYGTNAPGCARIIGSAQSFSIDLHSRTPYRSHIIVVTATLTQDEYLYGLRLSTGDGN